MPTFQYTEPESLPEALSLLTAPDAAPLGGGTDLLPQVKDGIVSARQLVGLAAIPEMAGIAASNGGLSIGAATTIAAVAQHPEIRRRYAALAAAAGGLATPQIRNQGTLGGNLCQRPRCWHYRSPPRAVPEKGRRPLPRAGRPHPPAVRHRRPPLPHRPPVRHRRGPQRIERRYRNRRAGRRAPTTHRRFLCRAGARCSPRKCA